MKPAPVTKPPRNKALTEEPREMCDGMTGRNV